MRRVLEDVKFMLDIELGIYWKFCWGYLIPISLTFFFVYFIITMEPLTYGGLPFPDMALSKFTMARIFKFCPDIIRKVLISVDRTFCKMYLKIFLIFFTDAGWIIMAFALAQVPLWAIRELCRSPEIGLVQVNYTF